LWIIKDRLVTPIPIEIKDINNKMPVIYTKRKIMIDSFTIRLD